MTAAAVAGGAVQRRNTGAYALQRGVERLGLGQVARHDLDRRRQPGRRRVARERAYRHARSEELGDHLAPDSAGGTGHQDGSHRRACHRIQ